MALINLSSLTFSDEEVRALNELVYVENFVTPDPLSMHMVVPGVVSGKKLGFFNTMPQVGKSGSLGSGPSITESTRTITTSEKTWDPQFVSDRLKMTWDEFENACTVYALKLGVQRADLENTEILDMIKMRLAEMLPEALWRVAWFGDQDAANTDDSPAGIITASENVNQVDAIDGFWKQLFDIATTTAARRVTISKNSQVTYTLQQFNSTDTTNKVATGILRDLKFKADMRLRGKKGGVIMCTQSVYDQYEIELGSNATLESSFAILQDGTKTLKISGIPVIPVHFWDRMIEQYEDNGTYLNKPHRAVYCVPNENVAIGLEDAEAFKTFTAFYDQTQREFYIDFEYKVDAKIGQDHLVQVAY